MNKFSNEQFLQQTEQVQLEFVKLRNGGKDILNRGNGKVYLTGGGCGDIELLTIKAAEVLRRCDAVVYDSLAPEALLRWTKPDCEKIYVGKRYGSHAMKQSKINDLLVEKALEGKTVVRLKGGDPYVFGRGGEEFLALQAAGISCEEIPGISSAIAVPAAAGIPVTHRELSAAFTVVTGTAAESSDNGLAQGEARLQLDFDALVRVEGTLVILMGMHHLKAIMEGLLAAGKADNTPCAIVMEGTTKRQKCMRTVLNRLYEEAQIQGFTSPAVIVVGAVAELELLSEESAWGKAADDGRLPLTGSTVGVTGTRHFADKLSAALRQDGAEVWDMSFVEACRSGESLPDLKKHAWLVFTSPNGVRIFLDQMRQEHRDLRTLSGKKIAVIGTGTAETLAEAGLYADYMPEIYDAAHLAEGLTDQILEERKPVSTLFLRAKQGSVELPMIFEAKKLPFVDYPLYELRVCEEKRAGILSMRPDYIVFGSAMGARAYFEGRKRTGMTDDCSKYVCIGESCGAEVRKHTAALFLTAERPCVEAIVECIRKDNSGRQYCV